VRLVLDTNTAISALLWSGVAHQMLLAAQHRDASFYSSPFLIAELRRVLLRPKFEAVFVGRKTSLSVLLRDYLALVTIVHPMVVPDAVADDPMDNHVLACAIEARADVVVSGDEHLLDLNPYKNIVILNSRDLLDRFESRSEFTL